MNTKSVNADTLFLGAKLQRGVSNMYYYVASSAYGYTTQINNAVNNWIDTGYGWNPIYMYPVSSNYATDIDFYAVYELGTGLLGRTAMYDINEYEVNCETTNWFFARIYLSTSLLDSYISSQKQGTIAHEIGHAFGLAHQNNNTHSIMCQKGHHRAVYLVDSTSHNAINTLYN